MFYAHNLINLIEHLILSNILESSILNFIKALCNMQNISVINYH